MLNQIYIHYITTLFVLESFIISCWLLKGKKIGIRIGIGQFAQKKSVSESATKNHDRASLIIILLLSKNTFNWSKVTEAIIILQKIYDNLDKIYHGFHKNKVSSTTVFNIDDYKKCFLSKSTFKKDLWKIMWHWRLE